MTLPTRPLGTSGMDITRVGFGAWDPQHPDDDLDEIALALERTRAGEGPIRPIASA
jgi:hypothetical protein